MAKVTVSVRFIPKQDSPKTEVTAMFKAALDLAHSQIVVDQNGARCASCAVIAACGDELNHSADCATGHVLSAWEALKHKVSRKQPASVSALSPISAA